MSIRSANANAAKPQLSWTMSKGSSASSMLANAEAT